MTDFSRTCWSYQPGLALTGVGVTARNNEISHGPHQAVLWSVSRHDIAGVWVAFFSRVPAILLLAGGEGWELG